MPRYWLPVFALGLALSFAAPLDRLTWSLDAAPAIGAALVLAASARRFPLTGLSYGLLLILCLLILAGAHYGFAHVPVFEWLKPFLGTERNQFDRLAHFFQGFCPAIVIRELLVRRQVVQRTWIWGMVPALCLALSAAYELVEWGAAVVLGADAAEFLGSQNDPFDAQTDMALALLGSLAALVILSRWHDRQLAEFRAPPPGIFAAGEVSD